MSAATLQPGDRVSFQNIGADGRPRRLRGVVVDALLFQRDDLVPVQRKPNRKKTHCKLDRPDQKIREPRTRWIERSKLRKLPEKAPQP